MRRAAWILLVCVPTSHAQIFVPSGICSSGLCADDVEIERRHQESQAERFLHKAQLIAEVAKTTLILEEVVRHGIKGSGFTGSGIQGLLYGINSTLQAGQALNMATDQLQKHWDDTFTVTPPRAAQPSGNFHADFTRWSGTTMMSLQNAALASQVTHVSSVLGAAQYISTIEGIINNVDAWLGAQRATAASGVRTAASIEAMHASVRNGNDSANVYRAYQLQRDISAHSLEMQFFCGSECPPNVQVPRDGKGF